MANSLKMFIGIKKTCGSGIQGDTQYEHVKQKKNQ